MYGSLNNRIMEHSKQPVPEVGMGATLVMWSDRRAGTITRVHGNTITWRRDATVRMDANGASESQTYRFEQDEEAAEQTFTLRKNGAWVRKGEPTQRGTHLLVGTRMEYHDYSF